MALRGGRKEGGEGWDREREQKEKKGKDRRRREGPKTNDNDKLDDKKEEGSHDLKEMKCEVDKRRNEGSRKEETDREERTISKGLLKERKQPK